MKDRALVLGGGGPVGVAWETGLIAGLKEGGLDPARANYFLGTSAGSFVGAQLASGFDPVEMAKGQMAAAPAASAPASEGAAPDLAPLLQLMAGAKGDEPASPELLRKMGMLSLGAKTMPETAFLAMLGMNNDQLPWPDSFACTAVDTASGEFRLWTKQHEVPIGRAIASSCSVPGIFPPVEIDGLKWMDGGMRSSTNADLAAGYQRVLIVAVTAGGSGDARAVLLERRMARERAVIADAGGRSELIVPDAASLTAFGPNLMDGRRRADVARAGMAQGRVEARRLLDFWGD